MFSYIRLSGIENQTMNFVEKSSFKELCVTLGKKDIVFSRKFSKLYYQTNSLW